MDIDSILQAKTGLIITLILFYKGEEKYRINMEVNTNNGINFDRAIVVDTYRLETDDGVVLQEGNISDLIKHGFYLGLGKR